MLGTKAAAPALFLALCLLFIGVEASQNLQISPDLKPRTVRLNESQNVGASLPEWAPQFVDKATGFDPEQIHLTYWGAPSKMLVSFASGPGQLVMGPPPKSAPVATETAYVQWGTKEDQLTNNASCETMSYIQDQHAFLNSPSYISPFLSHCLMTGLPAGTKVFYRVGWNAWEDFDAWSPVFSFKTFKDAGNFPFVVGVMADLGLSFNTTNTVSEMIRLKPNLVLNIGDLPYADNYLPNGKDGTIKKFKYLLSYQPRWDMYGRLLQRLAASVPMMTSTGNHEIEFQPDGTVFAAYTSRYPVPRDPSKGPQLALNKWSAENPSPDSNLYYSWEVPGTAHFIALTSYIPNDTFTTNTSQWKWFESDLKKVDRKKTPWLIIMFHAPIVSSYEASFKQVECMRLTYEPLLFKYGVDLVLNGHVHAYERSEPVYNYTLNPCGTVHITVGCGGKPGDPGSGVAALDTKFIEEGSFYCKDPAVLDIKPNLAQPLRCHTFQPKLGGFCWNKQPEFSAVREPAFGFASLKLLNATHAEWKWRRQVGGKEQITDQVMLNRGEPKYCDSKRG